MLWPVCRSGRSLVPVYFQIELTVAANQFMAIATVGAPIHMAQVLPAPSSAALKVLVTVKVIENCPVASPSTTVTFAGNEKVSVRTPPLRLEVTPAMTGAASSSYCIAAPEPAAFVTV